MCTACENTELFMLTICDSLLSTVEFASRYSRAVFPFEAAIFIFLLDHATTATKKKKRESEREGKKKNGNHNYSAQLTHLPLAR